MKKILKKQKLPFPNYWKNNNLRRISEIGFNLSGVLSFAYTKYLFTKGLTTIFATFAVSTFIFFAGPFQIIDKQSPIEKYKSYIQSHSNIIAYKSFDPAFTFYSEKRIPVFNDQNELEAYLEKNSDVLVLSRSKDLSFMDSVSKLKPIAIERDLFSTRSSGLYHSR